MLLMDWFSTLVNRPRMRRPNGSAADVASLGRAADAHDSGRPAAYPTRKPEWGSLPALIQRYAAPLERARRSTRANGLVWSDLELDIRRVLTACAPPWKSSLGDETIHTPSDAHARYAVDIDQAALVLTAGAWAVGHDFRVTHPTGTPGRPLSDEGQGGALPAEARKAIEPAIRFAYGLYRTLREARLATLQGPIDCADHEAQARSMYRTLASAAYTSCRAGLAFDDLPFEGGAESAALTVDQAERCASGTLVA